MTKEAKALTIIAILILVILAIILVVNKKIFVTNFKDQSTVKIGAILPLTGSLSWYGQSQRQGIELAVEDANRNNNGRKISIVFEDNQSNPKEAVNAAIKLTTIDGVNVIFSAFTNLSSAIEPIATKSHTVLIYQSTDNSIAARSSYAFKDYADIMAAGKELGKAVQREKINSLGLVYGISDKDQLFFQGLKSAWEPNAIIPINDKKVDFQVNDFKTILLQLKDKQGIVIELLPAQMNIVLKQLEELDMLDKKVFLLEGLVGDINNNPTSQDVIKKTAAISSWLSLDQNNPQVTEFINRLTARYHSDPTPFSIYFYDDVLLLAELSKKCNPSAIDSDLSECLVSGLRQTDNYQGIGGVINFSQQNSNNRKIDILKFINNNWVNY